MIRFLFLFFLSFPLLFSEESERLSKKNSIYFKFNTGASIIELNKKAEERFYQYPINLDFVGLLQIKETNHHIGFQTLTSKFYASQGIHYSYFYFFENKSFFNFSLFFGKGILEVRNNPDSLFDLIVVNIINPFIEENSGSYAVTGKFFGIDTLNFHEIKPSISYKYPIFENGYYLAGEIFYSYKKFAQKNKIPYFDTILLNGNEVGFQVGVSRRL